MRHRVRSLVVGLGLSLVSLGACAAPLGLLQHVLSANHVGKILRTFPGPDGLTGVVMQYQGSKAIAYLTPDGKYLISGIVANLTTGLNETQAYGLKYIGKIDILKGEAAAKVAFQCAGLSGITVGNAKSPNFMIAVFNPQTPMGYKVMGTMMGEAGRMVKKGALDVMALKLVPTGNLAPAILSADNAGREQRILSVLDHRNIGNVTSLGQRFAANNNILLKQIPVTPPFLVLYFPQASISAVIPIHNLIRVASAVASAENLAHGVKPMRGSAP